MAALTSASWTIVITDHVIRGTRRTTKGTAAIGDGASTYPTGGIPLPAISAFGMQRNLDKFAILGVNGLASDAIRSWDKTNAKLQLFGDVNPATASLNPEIANTVAPAARVYTWEAEGW